MEVSLRLNSFIVHMEYPGVAYRLGSLVFDDFTLSTIVSDFISISHAFSGYERRLKLRRFTWKRRWEWEICRNDRRGKEGPSC